MYREVINSPMVDVCAKPSTPTIFSTWLNTIFQLIFDTTPDSYQECPYWVCAKYFSVKTLSSSIIYFFQSIIVNNASVKAQSIPSMFPTGNYKLIFYFNLDPNTVFLTINMMGTVTSDLKETFGWKQENKASCYQNRLSFDRIRKRMKNFKKKSKIFFSGGFVVPATNTIVTIFQNNYGFLFLTLNIGQNQYNIEYFICLNAYYAILVERNDAIKNLRILNFWTKFNELLLKSII